MPNVSTSPQIADQTSPLESLMMRALRRYGETSPSTVDAESVLTFIDHANWIIDQVLAHPYCKPGTSIPYYTSQTERRPIPDHIMLAGLLYRHATDNISQKAATYEGEFYSSLSRLLMRNRFGVSPEFELSAVDYPNGKPLLESE